MVADDTNGKYESSEFDSRRRVDSFPEYFVVEAGSKVTVGLFHDSLKLPIPKPHFLQGRHGSCYISALFCFFYSLWPFSHPFLHPYTLAFKDRERICGEPAYGESATRIIQCINISNNWASFALYKDSCVALHSVSAEYLG